ncbi:MAG: hypothetical protein CMB31_04725 [Euryarchaeota archaeon]|nr:hypothetical protein [Euryarchaeota archaeon]|tara:strand:- start:4761 stop:5579 length:819 start_codon:yes stop_codon:yes gene_type:complete
MVSKFEKNVMLLLLITIVIPAIVMPLVVFKNDYRYHYPYASLPITIFNKEINEKPHRMNLKTFLQEKEYFEILKYIVFNPVISRSFFKYIFENKYYKKFIRMTVETSPFTLFNSHHLFGLYGIRFSMWQGDKLLILPQIFREDLQSGKLTNSLFASRHWQGLMYPIADCINRYSQIGELNNQHISMIKNILNHYLNRNNIDVDKITIDVTPIYSRSANEKINWERFCYAKVENKKVNGEINLRKLNHHPFSLHGVKELKDKFEYGLTYYTLK